jgi:predicted nucleotidyltransferase
MVSFLSKNIVATLCYYDVLDYPLTSFEIWKNLINSHQLSVSSQQRLEENDEITLLKVINELDGVDLKKYIKEYRGFYFLKGRKSLVGQRMKKNKISASKLKRLRRVVWLLRLVPYVRMIAATGTLAMKNAEKTSDWDLFVVLEKGKIWTGRTLLTVFVHLIGKRRHRDKIKDRVCLNYFITNESLKINVSERPFEVNLFSAGEYSFMIPLFGFKTFQKFQIKNSWIRDFKPNYQLSEAISPRTFRDTKFSRFIRTFLEKILNFDILENYLRKWEKEKIERNPKTHQSGSIISATDEALIFLPEPQGPEIFERFKEKLESIGA